MKVQNRLEGLVACWALVGMWAGATALGADEATDLNPATVKPAPQHPPIVLVENAQATATICVMSARGENRATDQAANELKQCIFQATDANLPVVWGTIVDGPAIVIGNCPQAAAVGLNGAKMPIEGFAVKTAPNRVFIVGHDDLATHSAGSAWGVYEFCERALGVRWYWPVAAGGRSVLPAKTLHVRPMWVEDAPFFRMREIWPSPGGLGQLHSALRSGRSWPVVLNVHAPHAWAKFDDFGVKRPEIFQLRKDGSRDPIMLCYGNPRTLETYLEVLWRVFSKAEPNMKDGGGIVNGNSITVSPYDQGVACACPDCQKLMDPNGGRWGTASRLLGTFVAKLGREVKQRWPDKTVIFLPYLNYTLAPKGIEFPDNVEVQLCGMPGVALYKEPEIYKQFQDNIDTWMKLTRRKVQTWDYSCWPLDRTKAPYHYPRVLKMYYQANRSKIVGTFINGVEDHWPRSNISLYCWMKLLWNPDFDVDAAMEEFVKRMFGPAAGTMRELIQIQADGWEKSRWPNGVMSAKGVYEISFPKATLERMKQLLAKAKEQIGDDKLLQQRLAYYETPFAACYKEYEFVIEGKGVRPLVAKKVAENPIIDGKLDDAVWAKTPATTLRKFGGKDKGEIDVLFPTEVKAVWTADGVTFGIRMTEPSQGALKKDMNSRDDGTLWWQDCAELYIDPSGNNSGTFAQLILTAGDGLWDSWGGDTAWTCEGLKRAMHVDKDYWSMEVFVPVKSLPKALAPATGVSWYGQITRHRLSDGLTPDGKKGGAENQKMNAQSGGFNANTSDFAPIRFEE